MITAEDVISPKGRLQRLFFPELSEPGQLEAHLEVYIADAYARGATDDSADLWVYHRAFTYLADRITYERPDESETGPLKEKFSSQQRTEWREQAQSFLAQFGASQSEPVAPVTVRYSGGAARTRFVI